MKLKKILIVLLHVMLVLGCLGIVLVMNRIAGGRLPEKHMETIQETERETETETTGEHPEESEPLEQDETGRLEREQEATSSEELHQEWKEAYHRWHLEQKQEPERLPEEEPDRPPVLMLASDLHYISRTTYDDGEALQAMMGNDDGKVSCYSDEMVDALLDEALRIQPTALLLTGDITLNGERENHEMLARKLKQVQEKGVPVLVIPGNHDIKNTSAATYFGKERKETSYLENGEEFYEIYREFGYDQALSRDENSLSYLYALDERHWLLLLDSCQYEDRNHVNGRIRTETMQWMEEQLSEAAQQDIQVTVAAHHNLLSESRLYTTECTLENADEVAALLEDYQVPLYISGHLHAQRIKKHLSEPGADPEQYSITEIVLSPYALPPCQYGLLAWSERDDMSFETKKVSVSKYAETMGAEDPFLLEFDQKAPEFLKETICHQMMNTIHSVPEDLKRQMAQLYAELYYNYCAGNRISRDEVSYEKAYRLWERAELDNRCMAEMGQMMEDVRNAMHEWKRENLK